MRVVIVTGLSGAGKSKAIRCLEDLGFYCVDNMPPVLLSKFVEMCYNSQGKLSNVALVVDSRGREMFRELIGELEELKKNGFEHEILFLEATDDVIIRRYKESRRNHPMAAGITIKEGIAKERDLLHAVKKHADYVIDTSNMKPEHLNENIKSLFCDENEGDRMIINVVSFGFKYGLPADCDLVFDVRFLPNPFYIEELRPKTGRDKEIYDYVMQFENSQTFRDKMLDMLDFLVPQYVEEGKGNLVIGIGCTGGKHRSVVMSEILYKHLKENDHNCVINHRDIEKDKY
ncbi:MAG: RNase adapter RapZ [Clostridia bacterium]|nr:RNase adapter RapZ [Clostridia bacterium]